MEMVYLNGSEQVANAGRNMQAAAQEMSRAAASISESVNLLVRKLEEFQTWYMSNVEGEGK